MGTTSMYRFEYGSIRRPKINWSVCLCSCMHTSYHPTQCPDSEFFGSSSIGVNNCFCFLPRHRQLLPLRPSESAIASSSSSVLAIVSASSIAPRAFKHLVKVHVLVLWQLLPLPPPLGDCFRFLLPQWLFSLRRFLLSVT